jgi:hypothetical protein
MKFNLGDEFTVDMKEKRRWLTSNVPREKYKILDQGFLYSDYYVEFLDEKYGTLYALNWPT